MNIKRLVKSGIIISVICLMGCNTPASDVSTDTVVLEQNLITENSKELTVEKSEPTITPIPTEEPVSIPEIKLIMVGDILLHTPIEERSKNADGSYDYEAVFANTKELISSADLAIVNEEVIIGGSELGISGYPAFNAPYELGDDLCDAGFDVICHATNHALDKGKQGIINCNNYWESNHPDIAMIGIYDSKEDSENIYIYEQDGIKIAILNYTYGTNGIALPSDMPYCVSLLDKDQVIADLQYAEENADFTIVCPHWGTEYRLTADESQKKWAQIFADNGADLIIGTHPHVIEPIENIYTENYDKEVPCYYSIGNFVNWTSGTGDGVANRMVGGMADVTISLDDANNVYLKEYSVTALVTHLEDKEDGITTYLLSDYSDELGQTNEIIKQDASFSYEYCVNLCNKVWGTLWK